MILLAAVVRLVFNLKFAAAVSKVKLKKIICIKLCARRLGLADITLQFLCVVFLVVFCTLCFLICFSTFAPKISFAHILRTHTVQEGSAIFNKLPENSFF